MSKIFEIIIRETGGLAHIREGCDFNCKAKRWPTW